MSFMKIFEQKVALSIDATFTIYENCQNAPTSGRGASLFTIIVIYSKISVWEAPIDML